MESEKEWQFITNEIQNKTGSQRKFKNAEMDLDQW